MKQSQNSSNATLDVVSEKQFRDGVMPRAQLSQLACEIALKKAANKEVIQFAEWELMEATTVIDVLQDLGTPQQALSGEAAAFLEKLQAMDGNTFDHEFMMAELSNHEFLRDLAQNYLDSTGEKPSGRDRETWHLAGLALFAFTEHVGLCKEIISRLV